MDESLRERAEFYTARKRRRRRGCLAVLLVPVVLLVAVGVWLGVRGLARPTISRDFVAEFNARYDGVPESDKAWPLYKEAALFEIEHPAPERVEMNAPVMPNWSMWDENTAWLREMAPALELVRQAAGRPVLGMELSHAGDEDIGRAQARAYGEMYMPATPAENPTLWEASGGVYLGHFRGVARMLAPDVYLALEEGDSDRAVRDIEAMLGVAVHTGESDNLIGLLVRVAIDDLTSKTMMLAISQHPDAFSAAELARLQRAFETIGCVAEPPEGALTLYEADLSMERALFLDMVQRYFSDDGTGDGRLTVEGAMAQEVLGYSESGGAVAFVMSDSRKDLVARYDKLMATTETAIGQIGAARTATMDQLDAEVTEMGASWISRSRNAALRPFWPVYPKMIRALSMSQSRRDAVIATIAMQRYRIEHGSFPDGLEALVPGYLPVLPIDPVDLKPMRYAFGADGPVLYSLGADGDDDGGRMGEFERDYYPTNRTSTEDGDWVLYPVAFPAETEDEYPYDEDSDDEDLGDEGDEPQDEPGG